MLAKECKPIIASTGLTKHYVVYEKAPGLIGSIKSLVRRRYRIVEAVHNVSFHIRPGEIVGFLGPNGAGKTTTLKMLSGLLYPTRGTIYVNGHIPQQRTRQLLRSITMVMGQRQQLNWDLTPADSFLVNKAIYEISDTDYKRRLGKFVELLHLGPLLNKQVRTLSLGERMKCELALALLHQPQILFLDEPTIGLDVNMQVAIRQFLKEYNERTGATVLLTSHYMADVTALARRIIVIDKGRLIFDGDLHELREQRQPYKVIKLVFQDIASMPEWDLGSAGEVSGSQAYGRASLERYGTVRRLDGLKAELLVERSRVQDVAAQLLGEFALADFTIEDIPVEEAIGELFGSPVGGDGIAEREVVGG